VPDSHWPYLIDVATRHFAGHTRSVSRPRAAQYDLAILHDPKAADSPSNEKALRKFTRAAEQVGFDATMIAKDDYGRIGEFDALFIRETTAVNHHTFRFSRRAAAEGLVVIDDPESIVRCTNKVYLAEALLRHHIASPRTLIVHRGNVDQIVPTLGLPCVLKQPDSSFSHGVVKVHAEEELNERVAELLEKSDLLVAQEYLPTEFDWRIGVFAGQPLWACRYHMARKHWQIVKHDRDGSHSYGKVESCAVENAPKAIVRAAVRAARLMGNGLYGVDLKEVRRRGIVIEVNDNPNIDAGYEDQILKDELYLRIMNGFLARVRARTEGKVRL
jgi:glutathione synthase/RimK-type ligase-like ATP-grasp enzyme